MDKNVVLESMYNVIKESLEWGFDSKDYSCFVDGVVALTEELLKKIDSTDKSIID